MGRCSRGRFRSAPGGRADRRPIAGKSPHCAEAPLGKGKESTRGYLLVGLWPAGEAAITAATLNAVHRASRGRQSHAGHAWPRPFRKPGGALPGLLSSTLQLGSVAVRPARLAARYERAVRPGLPSPAALPDWLPDLVRLGAVSCAGGAMAYEVMRLLGPAVVKYGPKIDEPIARWSASPRLATPGRPGARPAPRRPAWR
jgi:hypothetical protein